MSTRRQDPEERKTFEAALEAIGKEEPLTVEHFDALNVLEGPDLESFNQAWSPLPAGARARVIRDLHQAAAARLRLDYSSVNRLALDDEDPNVRLAGIQAALEDRGPRLLAKLLEILARDRSGAVRRAAAEDLSRFVLLAELEDLEPTAAAELRSALLACVRRTDEDPGVRNAALGALGYLADEAVAEEMLAGFLDPVLRPGAVRAMGRSADPRWTERLMPVLGSEDPDLRVEAARALGEIEDERAVGPLTELVDDSELSVRIATVEALGLIGGEEAREALIFLLEDPHPDVRKAADQAVHGMEDEEEDPFSDG